MTLRDFIKKYPQLTYVEALNCITMYPTVDKDTAWDLFHLEDYAVSTVSGPVYYLMAKIDYVEV